MEKDRLLCNVIRLNNGINILHNPVETGTVTLRLVVPIGSAHNPKEKKGWFHFLEHNLLHCSEKYPVVKKYYKEIGLSGGFLQANTGKKNTYFTLDTFPEKLGEHWEGFFSQIFYPIFSKDLIEDDIGVVKTEKKREHPETYPYCNFTGKHICTQWLKQKYLNVNDIFGTEKSLEALTVKKLKNLHKNYLTQGIYLIIIGECDLTQIKKDLESLSLMSLKLKAKDTSFSWRNKYRKKANIEMLSLPTYIYGGLLEKISFEEYMKLNFIQHYLINPVHGSLFEWLREEKSWAYNLEFALDVNDENSIWHLFLPLREESFIDECRKELAKRLEKTFLDHERIKREIKRRKGVWKFHLQHTDDILEEIFFQMNSFGKAFSEEEKKKIFDDIYKNPKIISDFYNEKLKSNIKDLILLPKI